MKEMRDIPGYEGVYAVTTNGLVWSYAREWQPGADGSFHHSHPGMWMSLHAREDDGYSMVKLCGATRLVHRLVARTYLPNPFSLPYVNHLNGIKFDNRVENLEWCTAGENARHAHRTGLVNLNTDTFRRSVRRNAFAAHAVTRKLTYEQADQVRRAFSSGESKTAIGKYYGISRATVWSIVNGRTYNQ